MRVGWGRRSGLTSGRRDGLPVAVLEGDDPNFQQELSRVHNLAQSAQHLVRGALPHPRLQSHVLGADLDGDQGSGRPCAQATRIDV